MPDVYLDGLDVEERRRQWAAQLATGPPDGSRWLVVEDDDRVVAGICAIGRHGTTLASRRATASCT